MTYLFDQFVGADSDTKKLKPLSLPDRTLYGSRVKQNDGVIKSARYLTHDTVELVVKCEEGSVPFNHQAGQYATLHAADLDKPRSYSFARAPVKESPNEYTFFIRLVPGGQFSSWLFKEDRTGSPLTIAGPMGKFALDESNKTIVGIAGGSGMSAIKALIEDAADKKLERDCLFLYGARTQRDLYCLEEIEAIKKAWHPDYKFESVMVLSSEPEDSNWSGATGFVTDYLEEAYLKTGKLDIDNLKVFFCGPPPMVDSGVSLLSTRGVAMADIHFDKFEDARSPAPVIDNSKCVLCDECQLVKPTNDCIVEVSSLWGDFVNGCASYGRVEPTATSGLYYNTLYIDSSKCIRCYACVEACPVDAISPNFERRPQTLRKMIID